MSIDHRPAIMARGFTLLEVLITVVIVGVLALIAYPSYQNQVQKARRAEGKSAILAAAVQMERYFTERNTYATATLGSSGVYASRSEHGYYTLSLGNLGTNSYTLTAAPSAAQTGDPCGSLTYTGEGVKGVSGSRPVDECW
jgi:type IV pilus assembly protein PilE